MCKELKWIDPDGVNGLEVFSRTLAVTGETAHKLMNWTAIHSNGLEHVDSKDWEVFNASHRGTHEGCEYIWGMFLEGLGAFNVMVPVERARKLSDTERKYWTGRPMVMVGSHTGKKSYGFTAHIMADDADHTTKGRNTGDES